ncbi:hypothetical protein MtrunA17_Chr7g0246391 [Medicago truncatula]|uniref:Transmembrane protein n=1 Tax=Medicago truncatula TaxID=3880 RepID=A0A396H236_MEDTR|nr:hypothetical protein MtrunA17_Chr7g0246391 [Medicago truncatula]
MIIVYLNKRIWRIIWLYIFFQLIVFVISIIYMTKNKTEFVLICSIGKTLERYQRCSFTSQNDNVNEHETQNWYQEMSKLKAKYESLQKSQRLLIVLLQYNYSNI